MFLVLLDNLSLWYLHTMAVCDIWLGNRSSSCRYNSPHSHMPCFTASTESPPEQHQSNQQCNQCNLWTELIGWMSTAKPAPKQKWGKEQNILHTASSQSSVMETEGASALAVPPAQGDPLCPSPSLQPNTTLCPALQPPWLPQPPVHSSAVLSFPGESREMDVTNSASMAPHGKGTRKTKGHTVSRPMALCRKFLPWWGRPECIRELAHRRRPVDPRGCLRCPGSFTSRSKLGCWGVC